MTPFDWLGTSTLVGNIVGWFLKNKAKNFHNQAIPYVQIGLAALKNFLIASGLLPATAGVAGGIAYLGGADVSTVQYAWLGSMLWWAVSIALDAALPIGLHSMTKNLKQLQEKAQKKAGRR